MKSYTRRCVKVGRLVHPHNLDYSNSDPGSWSGVNIRFGSGRPSDLTEEGNDRLKGTPLGPKQAKFLHGFGGE